MTDAQKIVFGIFYKSILSSANIIEKYL